jgi:hypothetical protein
MPEDKFTSAGSPAAHLKRAGQADHAQLNNLLHKAPPTQRIHSHHLLQLLTPLRLCSSSSSSSSRWLAT